MEPVLSSMARLARGLSRRVAVAPKCAANSHRYRAIDAVPRGNRDLVVAVAVVGGGCGAGRLCRVRPGLGGVGAPALARGVEKVDVSAALFTPRRSCGCTAHGVVKHDHG